MDLCNRQFRTGGAKWDSALTRKSIKPLVKSQSAIKTIHSAYSNSYCDRLYKEEINRPSVGRNLLGMQ